MNWPNTPQNSSIKPGQNKSSPPTKQGGSCTVSGNDYTPGLGGSCTVGKNFSELTPEEQKRLGPLQVKDIELSEPDDIVIQMLQEDIDGAEISTTNDPICRAIKRTLSQHHHRVHVCIGMNYGAALVQTWKKGEQGHGTEWHYNLSYNVNSFLHNFDNEFHVKPIKFSIRCTNVYGNQPNWLCRIGFHKYRLTGRSLPFSSEEKCFRCSHARWK